jgi:predicted transcriptional regulator
MKQKLTKAEEEVMQLLWEHEPATVTQLLDHFEDKKPAHSTVSTIIRILEDKGFVDHKAYGRAHVYHSIISKEEYSRFSLKEMVMKYFHGSMEKMVSFLVKENEVDVAAMENILEEIKEEKK